MQIGPWNGKQSNNLESICFGEHFGQLSHILTALLLNARPVERNKREILTIYRETERGFRLAVSDTHYCAEGCHCPTVEPNAHLFIHYDPRALNYFPFVGK